VFPPHLFRPRVFRPRVLPTLLLAACLGALLAAPADAPAGAIRALLYEWQPNGPEAGPQLILEEKLDLTGKFGVQCGKGWIFSYFGGGEHPPITFDAATGTISGTDSFPTGTAGIGSSYRAAEVNDYDFKSAGPLVMTLNAHATSAAAVGTLSLQLYAYTKARKHGSHKVKSKKILSASCSIPFDAPNHYAEAAAPSSESPSPEG